MSKILYLFTFMAYLHFCKMEWPVYEFDEGLKVLYAYHPVPAKFREARLRCYLEGAKLLSPLDIREVERFNAYLTKYESQKIPLLTGIHAYFSKGDYFSLEGVAFSTIPHAWELNEPHNNLNRENCVGLFRQGNHLGDVSCDDPFPYICYKPRVVVSGKCKFPGYAVLAPTGNCYKAHTAQRSWQGAFMACAAEGAYLVVLNSQAEAKAMATLYWKSRPAKAEHEHMWIGMHDLLEAGDWITVHGQTLKEAGYAGWHEGEPDNGTGKWPEYCGALIKQGVIKDHYCPTRTNFICEMNTK